MVYLEEGLLRREPDIPWAFGFKHESLGVQSEAFVGMRYRKVTLIQ